MDPLHAAIEEFAAKSFTYLHKVGRLDRFDSDLR
jgi:hypothetical protein